MRNLRKRYWLGLGLGLELGLGLGVSQGLRLGVRQGLVKIMTQQYHDKLVLRRGVCTHVSYVRKGGFTL